MTVVRRAVPSDAVGIAAVHADARLAGYRGFIDDTLLDATFGGRDLTEVWVERLEAEPPPFVLAATRANHLVGYCMLLRPSEAPDGTSRVAELTRMSVTPAAWRSGVGTALVRAAIACLRRDGWSAVTGWVLQRNERAIAFYSTLGFRPDGAQMIDPWSGQTEVRMCLPLAPT